MARSNARDTWYGRLRSPFVAIVFVLLLGSSSLLYPFGRDQAEYATIAVEIGKGKIAYSDVFNVKPPLTHILHAAALRLFGHSMLAIRLFDLVWQGLTASLLAILVERMLKSRSLAMLAALLHAAWYYSSGYWNTAQTDGFLTLPVLLSLLAYSSYQRRPRAWLLAASGSALGIATLFKYPIGIMLPLLLLALRHGPGDRRTQAGVLLSGFVLPIAMCLAVLAAQGALDDFLYIQATYIPAYNVDLGEAPYLGSVVAGLLKYLMRRPVVTVSLLCCFGFEALRRGSRLVYGALFSSWWLSAFFHLVAQNKFYSYHGLPLLAAGAATAAWCVGAAKVHTPLRVWGRRILLLALAVSLAVAALLAGPSINQMFGVASGRLQLGDVYAQYGTYGRGDYSVRADLEVAAYLQSHTSPSDTVFIWGFEPGVYFLAERSPATRFLYNFPLYGRFGWDQFRDQVITELSLTRPKYIVVVQDDAIPWVTGTEEDSRRALQSFPQLLDLIARHYRFEATLEHFHLYRRVSEQ